MRRAAVAATAVALLASCSSSSSTASPGTSPTSAAAPSGAGSPALGTNPGVNTTPSASDAPATAAPAAGGDTTGACALLTTAEVQAVVGAPVTATEVPSSQADACKYRPADTTVGDLDVSLLDAAPGMFDAAAANTPMPSVAISGVGDQAFFVAGAGELGFVANGKLAIVVLAHAGATPGTQAELTQLAELMLPRM
jgi:hypothetical protein